MNKITKEDEEIIENNKLNNEYEPEKEKINIYNIEKENNFINHGEYIELDKENNFNNNSYEEKEIENNKEEKENLL